MSDVESVARAVGVMDVWLDGMRGPGGYGGPVVHWWRDSMLFCGPGLDWRYEGIIAGYLALFERTGRPLFLEKARHAGEDLVRGQLRDGTFRHSSFELNPRPGGTPHEAAAAVGLLLLAKVLRDRSDDSWERYYRAAEKNIRSVIVGRLWNEGERLFADASEWFVPNKAATIIEALCLAAELAGQDDYLALYVGPTADAIVSHQLSSPGDPLDGGIAQASSGRRRIEKYFPYYTARSIPGLCAAHRTLRDERYLEAAFRAGAFLVRWREEDGGSPQVLYPGRRINRYPRWIAAAGDQLRALGMLIELGFEADLEPTVRWLLAGQLPSGAFRSAEGFGAQVGQRLSPGQDELRDVLPVVGWNDKAFRALAALTDAVAREPSPAPVRLQCSWRGKSVSYREDEREVLAGDGGSVVYRWRKGETWAWAG